MKANKWLVIVKELPKEKVTKSWLIIEVVNDISYLYEVINVWDEVKLTKEWDIIVLSQHIWDNVEIDWEKYRIIKEEQILAFYNK